jgi:hypothetical protein
MSKYSVTSKFAAHYISIDPAIKGRVYDVTKQMRETYITEHAHIENEEVRVLCAMESLSQDLQDATTTHTVEVRATERITKTDRLTLLAIAAADNAPDSTPCYEYSPS